MLTPSSRLKVEEDLHHWGIEIETSTWRNYFMTYIILWVKHDLRQNAVFFVKPVEIYICPLMEVIKTE